jgi:hypothetical protein
MVWDESQDTLVSSLQHGETQTDDNHVQLANHGLTYGRKSSSGRLEKAPGRLFASLS